MKVLSRRWRWRRSQDDSLSLPTSDDPTLNDSRPMDAQEQEEFIRSLEKIQAQQSRLWRRVFAGLLSGYIMFIMYSIFQQATSPWELRYYAYFMEDIPSWMIISADWVAVLVCSFAIVGILPDSEHHKEWMGYSWLIANLLAVFWLYFMLRQEKVGKFHEEAVRQLVMTEEACCDKMSMKSLRRECFIDEEGSLIFKNAAICTVDEGFIMWCGY